MSQIWTKWEPAEGLHNKYTIASIVSSIDGFEILLYEDGLYGKKGLKIIFENQVDSHRDTNESLMGETIEELNNQPVKLNYSQWTFFKVTNSEYIKWLRKQSSGVADGRPFIHFCFVDDDSILDVIACYEPKVEYIGKI